jgi:hypothetical protein
LLFYGISNFRRNGYALFSVTVLVQAQEKSCFNVKVLSCFPIGVSVDTLYVPSIAMFFLLLKISKYGFKGLKITVQGYQTLDMRL